MDHGLESVVVFEHPRLQRIVRGIKTFHAAQEATPVREWLPITRDILLRLLASLDQMSHRRAMLYAAFCLAFAAFLRIGEFTWEAHQWASGDFASWHATCRSIAFGFNNSDTSGQDTSGHHMDRLFFTLPASKSDPFRQGVTITIAAVNDRACAVSALHLLFTTWPSPSESPLFTLHHHEPGQNPAAFDRRTVVNELRRCITSARISGGYSGHSFRRGAATSARMAGVADHNIQLLGRWRSDAYKHDIEVHPEHVYNVSRRFQLHSTTL